MDENTLQLIMTACIIMHNMIVEDEGVDEKDFRYDDVGEKVTIEILRQIDPVLRPFYSVLLSAHHAVSAVARQDQVNDTCDLHLHAALDILSQFSMMSSYM